MSKSTARAVQLFDIAGGILHDPRFIFTTKVRFLPVSNAGDTFYCGNVIGAIAFGRYGEKFETELRTLTQEPNYMGENQACARLLDLTCEEIAAIEEAGQEKKVFQAILAGLQQAERAQLAQAA